MLPTIKTLWIGEALSPIENLALTSFLSCGHRVELFTYDEVQGVPKEVNIRDANEILGSENIFYLRKNRSVAAFADWFRYELLYKEGGVWVDSDVICLKPFDFEFDLFFGLEEWNQYNNAVLGAKPGHILFRFLADQAASPNNYLPFDSSRDRFRKFKRKYLKGDKKGNIKWGEVGPRGLTAAVEHFGLQQYGKPHTHFYPIHPTCWLSIFDGTYSSIEGNFGDTYAIHLWNEMMRRKPGFDKNSKFPENSLIEMLKRKYF